MSDEFNPRWAISDSITRGDVDTVVQLWNQYPDIRDSEKSREYWLFAAAKTPHTSMMKLLLDSGMDVNQRSSHPPHETPISSAVGFEQFEMTQFLLACGADPNIGRPIIAAMNCKSDELAIALVKLLVEHGANVNQLYPLYGNNDQLFTPLDWASGNPKIAEYLLSHGAKTSAELAGDKSAFPDKPKTGAAKDEVVAYFEEHFGPTDRRSLIEIVPTEPAIAVHVIPPTKDRKHVTLFTTGMSARPMKVPETWEEYQFAELFIQLSADWKYARLDDPNFGWPIHWLRHMAKYPHLHDTWLGGPVATIGNGEPPEPLAPNTKLTCVLLLAERKIESAERIIQLYRLVPLYTEERDLERREGPPALMRALDQASTPFIVDLNRKNVVI